MAYQSHLKKEDISYSKLNSIKYPSVKFNFKKNKYTTHTKCCLVLTLLIIIFWMIIILMFNQSTFTETNCNGDECLKQICQQVDAKRISGQLCMDLCIKKSIDFPKCSQMSLNSNNNYKYYMIENLDSSIVCSATNIDENLDIKDGVSYEAYEKALRKIILSKLNYTETTESFLNRLMLFGDVNKDKQLSLTEANNIWHLINNKHTFFFLILAEKPYIPKIKSFCGSCLEIEQIINQINPRKKESFIQSVFPISNQWLWLEWNYRCKISFGILEFFLDAISFNPNDEFGSDSLYLCSPIETSFGYTFTNEAKLIDYENLFTGKELQNKLKDRECKNDLDCFYNDQCSTKCDLEINKCSSQIVKPQIVDLCLFLRKSLLDNLNVTKILEPILDRCQALDTISNNNNLVFYRNEMPLSYKKHKIFIAQNNYWKNSQEFTIITNTLKTIMWDLIRYTKDPEKATKKSSPKSEIQTTVKNDN